MLEAKALTPRLRVPNEAPRMQHTGVPRRAGPKGRDTASGHGFAIFRVTGSMDSSIEVIINGKDSDRFCFKDGVMINHLVRRYLNTALLLFGHHCRQPGTQYRQR